MENDQSSIQELRNRLERLEAMWFAVHGDSPDEPGESESESRLNEAVGLLERCLKSGRFRDYRIFEVSLHNEIDDFLIKQSISKCSLSEDGSQKGEHGSQKGESKDGDLIKQTISKDSLADEPLYVRHLTKDVSSCEQTEPNKTCDLVADVRDAYEHAYLELVNDEPPSVCTLHASRAAIAKVADALEAEFAQGNLAAWHEIIDWLRSQLEDE